MISEWWSIISDPGHVAAELTFAFFEFGAGSIITYFLVKRHDKNKHGVDHES